MTGRGEFSDKKFKVKSKKRNIVEEREKLYDVGSGMTLRQLKKGVGILKWIYACLTTS